MALRVQARPTSTQPSVSLLNRQILPPTRRFSVKTKPECECKISIDKVREYLTARKRERFKLEMEHCRIKKDYRTSWDSYQIEQITNPDKPICRAFEAVKRTLPIALLDQAHIKEVDVTTSAIIESNLYILSSKPEEVTYAGEGGRHVGKKEYWQPIFDRLLSHKHLPMQIISIGGGIGYDAHAIAKVFREDNFNVEKTIVVDPNQLAAFLAEKVDYYVTISQTFLKDHLIKEMGTLYVFHLGTTLNVVQENEAVQILEQIAKIMETKDVLSLIMVANKQFEKGRALAYSQETEEGLSRVVNKKTGKHYKTVITNPVKFLNFMSKLGLSGELVEITEKSVPLEVAFVAYKSLK